MDTRYVIAICILIAGLISGLILIAITYYLNSFNYDLILDKKCKDSLTTETNVPSIELAKYNFMQLKNWAYVGVAVSVVAVVVALLIFIITYTTSK
jgi:hypothetical protein